MIASKFPTLRRFQGDLHGTKGFHFGSRRSLWFQELLQLLNPLVDTEEEAEAFSWVISADMAQRLFLRDSTICVRD
jgi:hypothetical protein